MLSLLRKYQKFIFATVAAFIICSFSFFGPMSSVFGGNKIEKAPDKVLGKLMGGKRLKKSELDKMTRFLASDQFDVELLGKGGYPNAFNNGILRRDFFETGLVEAIAARYFDTLQEELEQRLEKCRNFQSYRHPTFSFLSSEMIWSMWRPEIIEHLRNIKSQELSASAVKALGQLYIDQGHFPSHFLRHFLLSQEKQHEWIPHDAQLERADLTLCRNHSLEDWVGPRFINICAQLVLNGAALADQRGLKVSYPEARAALVRNALEVLQFELKRKDVSQEELADFIQKNLAVLGMKEQQAVEVLQKVLLFRSLLGDVGGAAYLDPLFYEQFHQFAGEEVAACHYQLPEAFRFSDFRSMLAFQLYIKSVGDRVSGAELPKNFRVISAVRPELREVEYQLNYALVTEDELALGISTKELWDYEIAHFGEITRQFPQLVEAMQASDEGKMQMLEKLDRNLRGKVDAFVAHLMIEAHPEWIESALTNATRIEKTLFLPLKGEVVELAGVSDGGTFLKALAKGEKRYCGDGKTHYLIEKAEKLSPERIVTFADAKARGTLNRLVHAELEKAYGAVREKDPAKYRDEKGGWKRLDEVFEKVVETHYASLLSSISKEKLQPTEYAQRRFASYVGKMHFNQRSKGSVELKGNLEKQWQMERVELQIARKAMPAWMSVDDFNRAGLSDVKSDPALCFFEIAEHTAAKDSLSGPMQRGQDLLSYEVKEYVMQKLLEEAPIYGT